MKDNGLSDEEIEHLLHFEGYGNKSAPYWFLGMEEGGGSMEELQKRAKLFNRVEYLHASLAKIDLDTKYLHVPTWRVMSKLIMAMQGMPRWQEASSAKEYQANKLGRADGKSFLTELMPLPCRSIGAWPYESIFPTKANYYEKVRPNRILWLRSEISEFQPRFVMCYGKGNWRHYMEIFDEVELKPELDGKIRIGQREKSTIVLLPFLSYDLVSTALITRIADRFRQ